MRALVTIAAVAAACSAAPASSVPAPSASPPAAAVADSGVTPVLAGPYQRASMEADVAWMCHPARKGRGSYQQGGKDTARWLARRFEELGYQVRTQEVAGGAVNVFAIKRAGPKVVLVSAHYDHLGVVGDEVFLGADDNASGVAVMLAMARAARTRRHRHTIVFAAFGAEEDGLKGSGAYVQDPLWPLSRTRAVIN
ncbi:MAG: M20/M25/M40 family metallo-hydrolase, partial [Deltaproteobacteria bacterium]|nr:M20/M25/M40 family metallo-hydrolase [Deltaproteobacteria bacterium]